MKLYYVINIKRNSLKENNLINFSEKYKISEQIISYMLKFYDVLYFFKYISVFILNRFYIKHIDSSQNLINKTNQSGTLKDAINNPHIKTSQRIEYVIRKV